MIAARVIVRTMAAKTRLPLALAARMALVALALALIAPHAHSAAQKKEAEGEPSAAAIKMSLEIVELKGSRGLVEPAVNAVIDRVKGMLLQTNIGNAALRKDLEAVSAALKKEYAPRVNQLMSEVGRYYATAFTEQELKEILAFYKSPVGTKVLEREPNIVADTLSDIKEWQNQFAEEVLGRYRTELKKRGHNPP